MARPPLISLPAALCDDRLYGEVSRVLSDLVVPQTVIATAPDLSEAAADVLNRAPQCPEVTLRWSVQPAVLING